MPYNHGLEGCVTNQKTLHFLAVAHANFKIKLAVIKDYESAFDAI